jgi:hypothetical protein
MRTIKLPCGGFGSIPDKINQEINVDGKKWFFDFDEYCGPLWLKSDRDTPRKCQYPKNKRVWEEFDKWLEIYKGKN